MIWVQGLAAFLVWVAYGYFQSRRSYEVRRFALMRRRETRGLTAALLLMAAIAVLFVGLYGVVVGGGFGTRGLTLWAWAAVALIGLVFVHLQTLALAIAVTMAQEAVTAERRAASTSQEPSNGTHEKPSP